MEVVIAADVEPRSTVNLEGSLDLPEGDERDIRGVIIFAHGSGSSRHSTRNRAVAEPIREAGFATLLFDLLTEEEAADRENVFNIHLLAQRLNAAAAFIRNSEPTAGLPVSYFGASTGAGAALLAAAMDHRIAAVVSRGGRPDLAAEWLPEVGAPTLLIVGGADHAVLELNRDAYELLRSEKRLEIVPGATHLFEEPGALERVAEIAASWFQTHAHPPRATANPPAE